MPRVYEVATGNPVDTASPEEANGMVLSGKYGFPPGSRQAIQLPDGTVGEIDAEHVAGAIQGGAKFIGDDGLADYKAKQKYGDSPIEAGVEGAVDSVPFLGAGAIKATVGSERAGAIKKFNPGAHNAGEAIGLGAQLFAPGEGEAAATIDAAKAAEEAPAAAEAIGGAAEATTPAIEAAPAQSSLIAPAELSPSIVREESATNAGGFAPREPPVADAPAAAEALPAADLEAPEAAAPAAPAPQSLGSRAVDLAMAPQRAISDLGASAADAAASHLADLGFSPTVQRIGASIARGAVEAPIYQVGANISDDVFDDHDLTAQSILAGTGTAALFGGGIGGSLEGALQVAGKYAPPALDRFAKWADRQQARLGLPESTYKADFDSALRATARMSDNLDELEQHWNTELKPALVKEAIGGDNKRQAVADILFAKLDRNLETAPFNTALKGKVQTLKEGLQKDLLSAKNDAERFQAFDDFKKGADAFMRKTGRALGGDDILLRQGVSEAVASVRASLGDPAAWGQAGHIQSEFNARYAPYLEARNSIRKAFFEKGGLVEGESTFVPKATTIGNFIDRRAGDNYAKFKRSQELLNNYHDRARELADVYGGYAEAGIGGKHVDVDQLAQHIDEMHGSFEKAVSSRRADLQGLTDAKTTPHLGWHHVPGVAGVLNASTRMLADHPLAMAGLTAAHLAGVPSLALAGGAAGLTALKLIRGGKSQFIANIAKQAAESLRAVSSKLDGFLNGVEAKAPSSAGALKSFTVGEDSLKRGEKPADSFSRVARELGQAAAAQSQGVDLVAERAARATPEMGRFAPNVQRALAQATSRTATYLASIMPKNPVPPTGIGDDPYQPSASARAGFERLARTVTQPMTMLEDLSAGTLTSDQVAALDATHPQWMQAVRGQMAHKLSAGMGIRLPYQKRLSLSTLMGGAPTHDSMRPDSMMLLQGAYAPKAPTGPTGGNSRTTRASHLGKLDFAKTEGTKFSGGI